MRIRLSDHFTYPKLLRFVFPSIIMMIFTSIYTVVDGLFVSNFVGKTSLAAINLIWPLMVIMGAVGFMIGAGGSALVSQTLGEKKKEEANRYFSFLIYVVIVLGIVLSALGIIFLRPIAILLGAQGDMLSDCIVYGRILLITNTFFMLQNVFQSFFVTAEKPKLGLAITVIAGVTNMVLDYVFIVPLNMGLAGAALATGISQIVGGILPVLYFVGKNNSLLRLGKSEWNGKVLLKTCTNGSSELMTNVSSSVVTMLYNYQLLEIAGENGVAAYSVIAYVMFIFIAIFFGYSMGSAPIVGYHYGAGNQAELRNIFKKSITILMISGIILTMLAEVFATALAGVFVGYDAELMQMTRDGFRIYAISFLVCGINIYGSAFFTALGNGLVSALLSFLRMFVFQVVCIEVLPLIFGLDGVWGAIVIAELSALLVTIFFFVKKRKTYHYI